MNSLVPIALFGWIPLVLLLFMIMRPRRAVIVSFVFAWLFLPVAGFALPGLPDYTKMSATCVGVLLGTVLFDAGRFRKFHFHLIDIPMVVVCLSPFVTSLTFQFDWYDGLSNVTLQIINWGLPYFIGRLYFSDLESLRELAIGIIIGGVIYFPLCLFELRMSPQLHNWVYGYHAHLFQQTKRWGGWRPTVFMQHGLAVGMWMAATSLLAIWAWFSHIMKGKWHHLLGLIVIPLVATTVLCKSTGAIVLLVFGVALLCLRPVYGIRIILLVAVLMPPVYMTARIQGWSGDSVVKLAESVSEERAASLAYRFEAEELLAERAMQRPLLGWGGWGRSRVYDESGRDLAVTDSLWIITLGQKGLVGLISLSTVLLIPPLLLAWRVPSRLWIDPVVAPVAMLSLIALLYMYDNLANAMVNPIFIIVIGGVSGPMIKRSLPALISKRSINPGGVDIR